MILGSLVIYLFVTLSDIVLYFEISFEDDISCCIVSTTPGAKSHAVSVLLIFMLMELVIVMTLLAHFLQSCHICSLACA